MKKKKKATKKAAKNITTNNGIKKSTSPSTAIKKSKKTVEKKKKAPVSPPVIALDPPKISRLKVNSNENDHSTRKFWNFVEPYVGDVVTEDVNFLSFMMSNYSKENNQIYDIPSLGCRKNESNGNSTIPPLSTSRKDSPPSRISENNNVENVAHNLVQQSYDPWCSNSKLPEHLIKHIVGALVDPDIFSDKAKSDNYFFKNNGNHLVQDPVELELLAMFESPSKKLKLADDSLSSVLGVKNNFNNRRVSTDRNQLDDSRDNSVNNCDNKTEEENDEVLEEILKCQQELKLLSRENEKAFIVLSETAQKEIESQQIRQSLLGCESEILKLSEKLHTKKLKKETVTSSSRKSNDQNYESLKYLIEKRQNLFKTNLIGDHNDNYNVQ